MSQTSVSAGNKCQPTGSPRVIEEVVNQTNVPPPSTPLPATISCVSAAEGTWDTIVMGAGVAGCMAARELARSGLRVLLVEKRSFPRPKVCGGCLNGAAMDILARVGLSATIEAQSGPVLTHFSLRRGSNSMTLPLPGGRAISRDRLDLNLALAAVAAGADFLPETTANLGAEIQQGRVVELTQHDGTKSAIARAVIVATGLGPQGLPDNAEWKIKVTPAARVGAGCILEGIDSGYPAGTIWMAVGDGGYVGLVRVEDNRLNIAAAFDLGFVRRHGSPGKAAIHVLSEAGCEIPPQLLDASWLGTPPLTRQTSPVASSGIFLIGDATGYVEPFTGEGMAWGLSAGLHVAPWVREAVNGWSEGIARGWIREHHTLVRRRQNVCRVLTRLLRCPRLLRGGMFLLERWPGLLGMVVAKLNAPSR
ncbi:MAG: putative oxidoreductase [Planctomycetaceae bacterium]|nr:putative oxidoreductase [Planctomycetaceae bacterium]